MIALTRLHGDQFFLNEDMIERVDPRTGDTAIFTVGGNVYAVKETAEEVAEAVRQEKAAIIRSANQAGGPRPRLSLVDNNDT
jgi:uncharacterized protein YlzI (FlbEa/FlbD family)